MLNNINKTAHANKVLMRDFNSHIRPEIFRAAAEPTIQTMSSGTANCAASSSSTNATKNIVQPEKPVQWVKEMRNIIAHGQKPDAPAQQQVKTPKL